MTAGKKYKIFKVCKELNLGHDTIIKFLEQKGVDVSGPNSSIDETLYLECLERFATDKEKADKLQARKHSQETQAAGEETAQAESEEVQESAYMKALKKSIEDGAEALLKPQEEKKPVRKRVTPRKKVEEPETVEEVRKPEEEKTGAKTGKPLEEAAGKPEEEKTETTAPETKAPEPEKPAVKKGKAKETEEVAAGKKPAQKELTEEEQKAKAEKSKKKGKGGKEDETISEKERKRRKALEMIRKDGRKRPITKVDISSLEAEMADGGRKRKSKKQKKKQVDLKEVQDTVKKTLASLDSKGKKPKRQKKVKLDDGEIIEENVIQVTEFISANDLANLMDVPVAEIIQKCLELGLLVSINQRLDIDTITLLAEEYGFRVEEENVAEFVEEMVEEEEDNPEKMKPRSPIVTIMGHVDHGKTSLLDYLRHSNIVSGEAGGITQHIGAYEVEYEGKRVTFLDTPGHEAFTAMRARGAQVTDIVILIIAADDAVMPQTDEALDHARAAGVKIVIAINKIDKPNANSERIRQQLADRNVLVEDWGGEYQAAEISAKSGQGVPELLEKVLLEAEMLDLKADAERQASGYVIESRLDKGKGAIATVLIQKGTLRIGDNFIAGQFYGKVRALLNERDERLEDVGPSQPALVTGFIGVPQAGDRFIVMKDERSARELSSRRQQLRREQDAKKVKHMTLAQISEQIKRGDVKELNILVKADVDGSAEALADSLIRLNTEEVQVNVIRKAVGPISESDVLLATASGAVIIGFNIRANAKAKDLAIREEVDIRLYRVVYDAINDVKMALEGLLEPTEEENLVGSVEIRETFKISRIGTIAGCYVLNGKITRNNKIRVVRDDVEIYTGHISSLKRFKEDVREVAAGFECGIQVENYNDIKVGDIIESYEVTTKKRQLA